MLVQVTIMLNVEEQDSTKDGIESAQNQLRSMGDVENIIAIAYFEEYEE